MADRNYKDNQDLRWQLGGHQPARALLLDVRHVVELNTWLRVIAALKSFFAISSSVARPAHNLIFTVYLLGSYPELLLPLSALKGNLCRLAAALDAVKMHVQDCLTSCAVAAEGCLMRGVADACSQFRRHDAAAGRAQAQAQAQWGDNLRCHQLEVIVISGADPESLARELDKGKSLIDTHYVRRIVLAVLAETTDDMETPCSYSRCSSVFDVTPLQTDDVSLQKFFYAWLLDSPSDSEHLHLLLPPASPADSDLTLKCDLEDTLINPAQLPHYDVFSLQPDLVPGKLSSPRADRTLGPRVHVHRLQASALIPVDSVCDSVTFGLPLLVQATTCWRLQWAELEQNAANLRALCQELAGKKQAILAVTCGDCRSTSADVHLSVPLLPRGYFILLPGLNGSLLLKAVAARELVLPCKASEPRLDETTLEMSMLRVQSSLTQVPLVREFNPLSYSSGLPAVLLHQATSRLAVRPLSTSKRKANSKVHREKRPAGFFVPTTCADVVDSDQTLSPHLGQEDGARQKAPKGQKTSQGQFSFPWRSQQKRAPDGFLIELE